jgi:hypothetical protein
MHRYPLNVVHQLYMLHDDMYNEDDHLLFDICLRKDKLNLDMFVDDDDFYVLKKNQTIKNFEFLGLRTINTSTIS